VTKKATEARLLRWRKAFASVLAASRRDADLTQSQVAEAMGWARNTVTKIEGGSRSLAVEELMEYTRDGERMTLTLALSYGGRQDIVEAARSLAVRARAGLVLPEEIDETFFHKQMTTHTLPDVDLLIRTGGETRVSDFLLFESAYAELVFLPIMWPDFRPDTLTAAVADFANKERRFGKTSEQVQMTQAAFDPVDRAAGSAAE